MITGVSVVATLVKQILYPAISKSWAVAESKGQFIGPLAEKFENIKRLN
jgi:hypothetical protein